MVEISNLNDTNYSGDGVDRSRWKFDADGVDRSRWKFDENGFALARDAALEQARRQTILAAEDENQKIIAASAPSAVDRSIDGSENATYDSFKL